MRYNTKRIIKEVIIIGCILLVGLWIGAVYFDIPQLSSINKVMNLENLPKSAPILTTYLSVGEEGRKDDISIIVEAVDFSNRDGGELVNRCVEYYRGLGSDAGKCIKREEVWINDVVPSSGAKFLYIKLKSTNVGKLKTPYINKEKVVDLYYADGQIPLFRQNTFLRGTVRGAWPGYGEIYPNITTEGWLWFEVPENINLAETNLEINGLIWKLG